MPIPRRGEVKDPCLAHCEKQGSFACYLAPHSVAWFPVPMTQPRLLMTQLQGPCSSILPMTAPSHWLTRSAADGPVQTDSLAPGSGAYQSHHYRRHRRYACLQEVFPRRRLLAVLGRGCRSAGGSGTGSVTGGAAARTMFCE